MSIKKLYPHNQQAFEETMYILNNTNKVAIVQATGSGKGVLAAEFINVPFKGKNVLVLAPGKDIIMNYEKSLGVKDKNVHFMTYAGLSSKYQKLKNEGVKDFIEISKSIDLLIVDEFHRTGAEKWGEAVVSLMDMLDRRGSKIIGLSATPIRYLDNFRNMADEAFDGCVVQGVTLEEAIIKGILPSFKYIVSMYGYKEDIERLEKRYKKLRKESDLAYTEGLAKAEDTINKLKLQEDEDLVLRETIQKEIKNLPTPQKWIVFCSRVEELKEMPEHLTKWFGRPLNIYNSKQFEPQEEALNVFSVYSDSEESGRDKTNKENLDGFYNIDKGISVIICVNKLNEGNHIENITGVIMLRRTISPIIYLQQMGRALSAGNKNTPIIFDFINNYNNLKKVEKEEGFKSIQAIAESVNNFLTSQNSKESKLARRIVIKNAAKPLMELFAVLDDLLVSNTEWSDFETEILIRFYPMRGAAEVHRRIPKRTLDAIDTRARLLGLKYNPKENIVQVNRGNALAWTNEENTIIMQYFGAYYSTGKMNRKECAIRLASEGILQSRTVSQIIDQYEKLNRGFIAKDKNGRYENEGKPWSKADVQYLRDAYEIYIKTNRMPWEAMSASLGRSISAIKGKLRTEGIAKAVGKRGKWTEEEEDFAWIHQNDMTHAEIGKYLNRPTQGVTHKLERLTMLKDKNIYQSRLPKRAKNDTWTNLEEDYLMENWDSGLENLKKVLSYKTEQQIKDRVAKLCRDLNYPYPFK